jgi:DNA phosphorothioation-dependent restriction protein DptG
MQQSNRSIKNSKPSNLRAVCQLLTDLMVEQLASDMASAQEQLDEASAAVDAIVSEVQSLEKEHSKQKVALQYGT